MSTTRPSGSSSPDGPFPLVRRGYDRQAVDEYTRRTQSDLNTLHAQLNEALALNQQLRTSTEAAQEQATRIDYGGLGGRAQEILRLAEEQARDVTQRASQHADQLTEQVQSEIDHLRGSANQELAEIRERELSELAALRDQGERDAAAMLDRSAAETHQLLASARQQAEAVRVEAEAKARDLVDAASIRAQGLVAQAEREVAEQRSGLAAQHEKALAELAQAQAQAEQKRQAMLAETTAQQKLSTAHLTAEAEQAAELRRTSMAEAERVKLEAAAEAEHIVSRAQQQAAAIDERARQEFAWRRRQMRHEQDLLARRKQAMLSQLTSLSALAVETAESLPDVPELDLRDFEDRDDDADRGVDRTGGRARSLEEPLLGLVQAPQSVVVHGDAGDAAVRRQDPGLGLDLLSREHPFDGSEQRVAAEQLEIAGQLFNPVDLPTPLDLDGDVAAGRIAAEQVHRADGGRVLPAHQSQTRTQGGGVLGQQCLEVSLHPVLAQAGVDPQVMGGVGEDLPDGDLQGVPVPTSDLPEGGQRLRAGVAGGRRPQVGERAGRAHPVQRLVRPIVGMDRDGAVCLDQDQPGGHRQMGGQPPGVVDLAPRNHQPHADNLPAPWARMTNFAGGPSSQQAPAGRPPPERCARHRRKQGGR